MNDIDNENSENAAPTNRLNFGQAKTEPVTLDNDAEFISQRDNITVEEAQAQIDARMASDTVVAPVDGSQADVVADVVSELVSHTEGSEVAPETILEEAPAAVSVEVAAKAASEQSAQTLSQAVDDNGDSIESLRAKQDEINRQIAAKTTAEKSAVIEQIKTVVSTYNITTAELVEALGGLKQKRQGSKAKAKYRNSEGKEWSGRGKEPLWIKGQNREQFLITE